MKGKPGKPANGNWGFSRQNVKERADQGSRHGLGDFRMIHIILGFLISAYTRMGNMHVSRKHEMKEGF